MQIEIYKHFQDPLEAKQLFIRMATDYGPWDALMGWVNEGYPGTWHDWWKDIALPMTSSRPADRPRLNPPRCPAAATCRPSFEGEIRITESKPLRTSPWECRFRSSLLCGA